MITLFAIGCALAGAAGGLVGPFYVNPYMGHGPLLRYFYYYYMEAWECPRRYCSGGFLGLIDSFIATLFDSVLAAMAGFILIIIVLSQTNRLFGHE